MKRLIYFTRPAENPGSNPGPTPAPGSNPTTAPNAVPENTAVTGTTPNIEDAQRTEELRRVKERVGGTNGKVKSIVDQITAIQTKVSTLGFRLENKLQAYLRQKTGKNDLDINNATQAQTKLNEWLDTQQVANIESIRDLDRKLDLVDLRVQFRKGLQERFDQIGNGLNDQVKSTIGEALERQLDLKEGQIDARGNMQLGDFKRSLEITHEITKYANLLNVCKSSNANSLTTARFIPEFGIAYPQTRTQNANTFKYFTRTEGSNDIVYCIDTNGLVQRLNPFSNTAFTENVWEVVYRPGQTGQREVRHSSFPASEFPTAQIMQNRADITELQDGQWQQMMANFARERTIISAASRGFTGMPPAELARYENVLGQKWREFQTAHQTAYRSTPGISSGNHPIRQTFDHFNSAQFTTDLQTINNSIPTVSNRPTGATSGPGAAPGTTPGSTPDTPPTPRPGENPALRTNPLLTGLNTVTFESPIHGEYGYSIQFTSPTGTNGATERWTMRYTSETTFRMGIARPNERTPEFRNLPDNHPVLTYLNNAEIRQSFATIMNGIPRSRQNYLRTQLAAKIMQIQKANTANGLNIAVLLADKFTPATDLAALDQLLNLTNNNPVTRLQRILAIDSSNFVSRLRLGSRAEANQEEIERVPEVNRLLRWPANGAIPVGTTTWTVPQNATAGSGIARPVARIAKPDNVRERTLSAVFINGRQVENYRVNIWNNGQTIALVGRAADEENVSILLSDRLEDGSFRYERVRLNIGDALGVSEQNKMSYLQLDPSSIARGVITSNSISTSRIGVLTPSPGVDREVTSAVIVGGPQSGQAVNVRIMGDQVLLERNGPNGVAQRIEPPARLRINFRLREWSPGMTRDPNHGITAAMEVAIDNPPLPPESSVALTEPEDGKIDVGDLSGQLSGNVRIARLPNVPGIERKIFDPVRGAPHEHPFLVERGNSIFIKRDVDINLPHSGPLTSGDLTFIIGARALNSTGEWRTAEHTLSNEETSVDYNTFMSEHDRTFRAREVRGSRTSLMTLPRMRPGHTDREITGISIDGNSQDASDFIFQPSDSSKRNIIYTGSDTIYAGTDITITIRNKTASGTWSDSVDTVTLRVRAPEAVTQNDLRFEGGEVQNGYPQRRIQAGPLSPDPNNNRILRGLQLSRDGLEGASNIRITHVASGTRNSPNLTVRLSDGSTDSIIQTDRQGRFVLHKNAALPNGPLWVKVQSTRGGQTTENWMLIQNEGVTTPNQEDVRLIHDRIYTNNGVFGSGNERVVITRLLPPRPGVLRRQLVNIVPENGAGSRPHIQFNQQTGELVVNREHHGASGKAYRLTFNVTTAAGTSPVDVILRFD